ncbi:HAD family hydrolase [Intestinimonas massiliensis (ex Afouda et al. 2020)]|uniref:HAD family hydrolase n=1 Tax=Intestinimonas massiliensis (ex Afouda et al. 2020) TaxID=1673721 RepID=UPI0010313A6C|nr:HAD family phosphatase [Intestinimonas massiliensis (ex Afouda et al. 2020)]
MNLFDFDGTLVDSNGVWVEVDDTFLARRGLTATREYSETVGHSIFPIAARFTKDYYHLSESPDEIMAEWTSLGREAYSHQVPLKPGTKEYLDKCRQAGERMVLLTACVPEFCQAAMDRLGLTDYFQPVIYVQELGVEKRDPRAFTLALERLGEKAEACTLYEDSPGVCRTAKEAGLTVVGVYDPFYAHYEDEMRGFCHRYIKSFTELL